MLPPDQRAGRLYDGKTARPHAVVLELDAATLRLVSEAGSEVLDWPSMKCSRDGLSLTDTARPDWRLRLDAPLPEGWRARLPLEGAATADDRRRIGMAVTGVLAAGVVLWFGGTMVLNAVAHRLPRAVTAPIGIGIVEGLGRSCSSPAGDAAAKALMIRLQGAAPSDKVRLTIIDQPVVNAMALPGGQVVIFDKLIAEAQSPDELAGVLAHELSHIQARDSERALVRQLGLSLLLTSLGGNIAAGADTLLLLASSREAEAAADEGAITFMRVAGIATAPTAEFFDRQENRGKPAAKSPAKAPGKSGKVDSSNGMDEAANRLATLADITASHPDGGSRSRLFKTASIGAAVTPALNAAQWQALKTMCAASRPRPETKAAPSSPPGVAL